MKGVTMAPEKTASTPTSARSMIQDFRDPLATIRAGSEILIRAGLSEQQIQRIARNVQGASVCIQKLIDEFLNQYQEV
jgi:hypothetical protein